MAKFQERKSTILGAVEEAKSTAEELRDELQNWLDNLPESLQSSSKADELQEAIDGLEEGISQLEDAESADVEDFGNYEFTYQQKVFPPSAMRNLSRAKRLELATSALSGVPTEVPEEFAESEESDEMERMLESVQTGLDALSSVSFPAMR